MRRLIEFNCEGEAVFGSLDEASGTTGLLIVSGGNEIRCSAHRGMALLAADIAGSGTPVFRFDRRGIGDSSGQNQGFLSSGPDINAALAVFKSCNPQLTRLIGLGNCDAATALLLHAPGQFDRLILTNPWIVEDSDPLPPAAAIRSHYLAKLRDPASLLRLARGKIDLRKFAGGLLKILWRSSHKQHSLAHRVIGQLRQHGDVRIILAAGDATAIAFADAARRMRYQGAIEQIDTPSHSFARPSDKQALWQAILKAID